MGILGNEKYIIVRFVSWNATHDRGHSGMSYKNKLLAVEKLSKEAKVFISSENELPPELEKYRFPLSPEKMHDAIAFASLMYGESATMATEGAVLGVPGIYLDNTSRLYTKEIEKKYGLIINYTESESDQLASIEKAIQILKNSSSIWEEGRRKLLGEKINVTAFLIWLIENYPESKSILRRNPEYQLKFS